jgi:nucleoside 2-deoxyribosyltransferase
VYLAGGMKDGWQDQFTPLVSGVEWIDPRKQPPTEDPAVYTKWDLDGVRRADAVVAYMSPSNPSGYGLALEIGFAHALGRPIIFIDRVQEDWRGRYFDMARQLCIVVPDFETAGLALVALRNTDRRG